MPNANQWSEMRDSGNVSNIQDKAATHYQNIRNLKKSGVERLCELVTEHGLDAVLENKLTDEKGEPINLFWELTGTKVNTVIRLGNKNNRKLNKMIDQHEENAERLFISVGIVNSAEPEVDETDDEEF